ncbi:NADP-dependent oxidoreductase domain-containing protein [Diplogelasinospora grovesii]|uniref:NADP-dependent oxidoreductase domain-containing protein n=1 Tax=Diplogelasinospora grovesii TaxID=303347 RepID=A0AAN6NG66_9PEZI|nr:NADP-dependent oxidoreductase domain-containing protein [Diplogelasinospora grovesii]
MAQALPASLQASLKATKVEHVKLGSSGLRVSFPIMGCVALGSPQLGPWMLDEEQSLDVLKAAYDCGISTWDTANTYSNGLSEAVIGNAMRKFNIPRHKVVIMTKCYFCVGEEMDIIGPAHDKQLARSKDYANTQGLSRNAIFKAVDDSLARLGTAYIDLLQLHRYDYSTAPEETMKALHDVIQSGKVRYIGACSMWATQFAELQFIAEKHNWTKFVSMQNDYNLCYREEEREMIRFCKRTGVGVIPCSPLFFGRLARPLGWHKSIQSNEPLPRHLDTTEADELIIRRVEEVANHRGWEMTEVALAWHKDKGTIPIVDFNSAEKIEDVCELRGKTLTDREVQYLEEPYIPRAVAGHA